MFKVKTATSGDGCPAKPTPSSVPREAHNEHWRRRGETPSDCVAADGEQQQAASHAHTHNTQRTTHEPPTAPTKQHHTARAARIVESTPKRGEESQRELACVGAKNLVEAIQLRCARYTNSLPKIQKYFSIEKI